MGALHIEALTWLRYAKRMPIVVTEAGPWNADVLGISDKLVVEVEIKASVSDLQREFKAKRTKHWVYSHPQDLGASNRFVPNFFYFMVPMEILEKSRPIIEEHMPAAGIVGYLAGSTRFRGDHATSAKRPQRLHDQPPSPALVTAALMRMSSELCGLHASVEELRNNAVDQLNRIETNNALVAARAAGALDCEHEGLTEARAAELATVVGGEVWAELQEAEKALWREKTLALYEAQQFQAAGDWRTTLLRLR